MGPFEPHPISSRRRYGHFGTPPKIANRYCSVNVAGFNETGFPGMDDILVGIG